MLQASEPPATARAADARARPEPQGDVALWKLVAGLVVVVTVLATTLILLCFLAAWLVTGHAIG